MRRSIHERLSGLSGLAEEVWSNASDEDEQALQCDADEAPPAGYSHVGEAAYKALASKHAKYRGACWNNTHGACVGEIVQTPAGAFYQERTLDADIADTHSDFFPEKMGEIISRATEWVDFASLGPPDGKFLKNIAAAIKTLADSGNSVTVRVLTGNIVGMPTDNDALCQALTEGLNPEDSKLKLYVGSWRKGVSWNHSKIIAVDGKYLLQGGHNVWDPHYLQHNPVRDLTMEAEGQVAQDGHIFCNRMWKFVEKKDRLTITRHRAPDWMPMAYKSRVGICRWPPEIEAKEEYPPTYVRPSDSMPLSEALEQGLLPMITCGRYGSLHHCGDNANPSDSAFVAMLDSAQKSIKMSLQDLGPIAIPLGGRPCAVPGTGWPEKYVDAIGRAIYERGVDVEIVLSYPNSIPSNLGMTEANYGNGWTCDDVAAEIVKSMKGIPDYDERRLAGLVGINLRVAYIRSSKGTADWPDKKAEGNHAKFFIVDDAAYYVGSQNLYVADLAEWGVIVDSAAQTQKVLEEYWNRVWFASYENVPEEDRDMQVDSVLASLDLNRNPVDAASLSADELEQVLLKQKAAFAGGSSNRLTVWLKRAKNLKNADGVMGGVSDPYAVLRLVDGSGKLVKPLVKSRVVDNDLNPQWNEQFDFEGLDSPSSYTLKINVLDQDSFLGLPGAVADWLAADDALGEASVDLSTLRRSEDFQDMDLEIAKGWLSNSTVSIGLHNWNEWGS
jgi:phosphatidylserine/phosphatidylglycerophosphate/cardiolipin synthase-like enzyme